MKGNKIAIVAGQGGYNDMGLVRSCGEAGMQVVLIVPEDTVIPIHKSRYVTECIRSAANDKERFINIVRDVYERHDGVRIVLFPASDLYACMIDDAWAALSHYALVPNAQGRLRQLMDKHIMTEIAESSGLCVPRSLKVDLSLVLCPEFGLPCIIKPLRSISGEKGDIRVCRTSDELSEAVEQYRKKGFYDVLLQEFVYSRGQEEVAVTGVCTPSGIIVTYGIIHKIRIRGNGSTVFARFEPEVDKDLQTKIRNFMKSTGYIGIFDIEFLHNSSGYHFIECNFRNGAYGYAVTSAGFNMPEVFACDDESVIWQSRDIRRITFMEERSDLLNMLEGVVSPLKWILDFVNTDTCLWWNWRDPAPLLRVPECIKKVFRK
ncbi:MAG: ATP-grasp domain-containing protein [Muribaculaceae bacterium]|nr:ATP-grasp domain-containing protein [Muribaculaceae bacterium]